MAPCAPPREKVSCEAVGLSDISDMSHADAEGSADLCIEAPPPPSDAVPADTAMLEEFKMEAQADVQRPNDGKKGK